MLQWQSVGRKKDRRVPKSRKIVDETCHLGGGRRGAVLKEEVWCEGSKVVKYSLAYINPRICPQDNGRVLGYDNNHGQRHRHFWGSVKPYAFSSYEELVMRFQREVEDLWRQEDAQDH